MAPQVFAVPVFLVVFRETLETVIIVSVLLAWLKQTLDGPERDVKVYKKLRRQVNSTSPLPRSQRHEVCSPSRNSLTLIYRSGWAPASASSSAW